MMNLRMKLSSTSLAAILVCLVSFGLLHRAHGEIQAGPYLQKITEHSVQLIYEGDVDDGPGTVSFGETTDYTFTLTASNQGAPAGLYRTTLPDLSPSTLYFYRLTHEEAVHEGSFYTKPAKGEPFTFTVVGDTRSGHSVHRTITERIIDDGYPDLLFHTGDLVNDGTKKGQWRTFFSIEEDLLRNTIFCPSRGNHDRGSLYGHYFASEAETDFIYAFPYGNAFFMVLNTQTSLEGRQVDFVSHQLKEARENPDIDFIFVFFHKPGVTTSSKHAPDASVLENLLDLFETYNVDAIFTGHNHCYEHGIVNGVHYIVSGGGGVELYGLIRPYTPEGWNIIYRNSLYHYCNVTVSDTSYTVESKDTDGVLFDTYTATIDEGGYPGDTPRDLAERARVSACGGCSSISYQQGNQMKGPATGIDQKPPSHLGAHILASGFLYGFPAFFILSFRRRLRRQKKLSTEKENQFVKIV